MVQGSKDEENPPEEGQQSGLSIVPLEGVDINNAAARLQSRGDVSDNNIFEILPRFSIGPAEDNETWDSIYTRRRNEVLTATSGGDTTCIAVGCELLVFEKDSDKASKKLQFSAPIDFIVWRRSLLLLGLSSSEIILLDPNTYNIKYSWKDSTKQAESNTHVYVDGFIHANPDPTKLDVIIVARNGTVFQFSNISLSDGSLDTTHDQNVSLDVDVGTIKDVGIFNLNINEEIVFATSPSRNRVLIVEKQGRFLIADLVEEKGFESTFVVNNVFSNLAPQLLKTGVVPKKLVAFEGHLFLLLSNGTLEIFLEGNLQPAAPLRLPFPCMAVHDFKLVLNINEGSVKLWALYGNLSSQAPENYIGIFNGPDFVSEFNFQLPVVEKIDECSYFKFPKNVSPFEEPTCIVEMGSKNVILYHVLETSTDVTLQKLLSRGKYNEATDLAISYKKDLDIVRKAEARDKLNTLSLGHFAVDGNQRSDALYMELLALLKEITDAEFVCNFCVQAKLQKVPWIKEILALGKGRIHQCPNTSAATSLLLTLKKFFTFELVYPAGTIADWNTFISVDNTMFLQSTKFLKCGNYDKCERVWRRHSEEFVPGITLQDFLPFFQILFEHQLKSAESVSLLRTIFPFSVEKVAQSGSKQDDVGSQELNVLINLIVRQVNTLESKIEWPVNALNFIKVLSSVIKDEMKRLENSRLDQELLNVMKKKIVKKISTKLDFVIQVLEELTELKRNHSIRILFVDYTTNEIPEVINKLLYKLLSKEEVESFVSKYLRPYAERKTLNIDQLFADHIKSVLQHIHYYVQAINIPHEERIICLVNLITSTKTKLECTLNISEEWPVPWTPGIDAMVKQILDTHNRGSLSSECAHLYDTICIMRKQVPYRCVLNKYKLNGSKLCISRTYVIMALLKIMTLKKTDFKDDCKELLKNIPGMNSSLDEFRLEYLEFIQRLYDDTIENQDVIPDSFLTNTTLKKAMLHRVFLELQHFEKSSVVDCDPREQERFIAIFNYLAAESNDFRMGVVAALKKILPSVPLDIMWQPKFPYEILNHLIEASESYYCSTTTQLFNDCNKLSRITQTYLPDMLLAFGSYFTREGLPGNPGAMMWAIVEYIAKSPLTVNVNNSEGNQELLGTAGFTICKTMLQMCPNLSLEQMDTLHEFMCIIACSFDNFTLEISQLLHFYRIFLSLKEQEIPLEHEFLEIYKWLGGEFKTSEIVMKNLRSIGETLIKFGETDLYSGVFKSIHRHLQIFVNKMEVSSQPANYYNKVITDIGHMKNELLNNASNTSDETADNRMRKLVSDLNKTGVRVNVYALKIRNKVTLLEKLLKVKNFVLAAELAIVFNFYEDLTIWSSILQGFLTSCTLEELQQVLESIKNVSQLWMLPEFADAWRKVSEQDRYFYDLCPIYLE